MQINPDNKPYQVPQRCVAYAVQRPFKEYLEQPQQQDIITALGMDETAELCKGFFDGTKANWEKKQTDECYKEYFDLPWIPANANHGMSLAHSFCFVHYYSRLPIIKKTKGFLADSLILVCKIIFAENGLPKIIMSDVGSNFVSERFKEFCRNLKIEQAVSLSYHHQSNRQVGACIKFMKWTLKKCFSINTGNYLALLQVRSNPLWLQLPSPETLAHPPYKENYANQQWVTK